MGGYPGVKKDIVVPFFRVGSKVAVVSYSPIYFSSIMSTAVEGLAVIRLSGHIGERRLFFPQ